MESSVIGQVQQALDTSARVAGPVRWGSQRGKILSESRKTSSWGENSLVFTHEITISPVYNSQLEFFLKNFTSTCFLFKGLLKFWRVVPGRLTIGYGCAQPNKPCKDPEEDLMPVVYWLVGLTVNFGQEWLLFMETFIEIKKGFAIESVFVFFTVYQKKKKSNNLFCLTIVISTFSLI